MSYAMSAVTIVCFGGVGYAVSGRVKQGEPHNAGTVSNN